MNGQHPCHGSLAGPVVMIGFGSIGQGTLPLILRHFDVDPGQIVVVDPGGAGAAVLAELGVRRVPVALTPENSDAVLTPLLGPGTGFCVNVSVDTGSVDILRHCRELGALYVDTVIEPWPGFYDDPARTAAERSNYALRRTLLAERAARPGGPTAVSACGANPGMVSWLVKQALLDVAAAVGGPGDAPTDRTGWAGLMRDVGVTGIHIAERDTQRGCRPRPDGTFRNTWSVAGFIAEGLQPAELGWGTHERWLPPGAECHAEADAPSIYLRRPGADTRVRTWCPTRGAQFGLLVTHNESISIADHFTLVEDGVVTFRPTCHYAYHPADDALMSWHDLLGNPACPPRRHEVLAADDTLDGIDELGVLLYGHVRNAYWYGSRLSIEETRRLAPHQNATGLQVTSAVLAAMVWALENPAAGIVEADDMDFARCLEVQRPYLGAVEGHFTAWHPLADRQTLFPDDTDPGDPWQFRNVLVH